MIGVDRPESRDRAIVRGWVLGKVPEADLEVFYKEGDGVFERCCDTLDEYIGVQRESEIEKKNR